MTRTAVFPLLLRPATRSLRRSAVLGACGAGLIASHLMLPRGEFVSLNEFLTALRVGAIAIALAVPFAFEDPAEDIVGPAPTPLWARRASRLAVVLPVLAAAWALSLVDAGQAAPGDMRIPIRGLTLEFAALVAGALALTAAADRLVPDRPGILIGGPAMLAVAAGLMLLPGGLAMFVNDPAATLLPSDPPGTLWSAAHDRWWIALGAAGVLVAWCNRDPGRRGLRPRLHRPRHAGTIRATAAHRRDTSYERVR